MTLADSPKPVGCRGCVYYHSEGLEGYDYWWPSCSKAGNERLRNLKSFPFKTHRPCFDGDFSAYAEETT